PPPSSTASNATSALAGGGVAKRYRPAPAKTFQCRGYGECRMVFSRSEHLARHIRKHTGERPFTCHCSKQFSRLDNLRQHAQTVHADKAALNEGMMRELTTLHATMVGGAPPSSASSATTATAGAKGKKAKAAAGAEGGDAHAGSASPTGHGSDDASATPAPAPKRPTTKRARASAVKREPEEPSFGLGVRPGTSTGYEGA
ncbi:hypothetical protein K438DRAFT_1481055, partial [Mycena galopus ATCC 62051]